MPRSRKAVVLLGRAAVLVCLLAAWELLPRVPRLRAHTFLDPNFISLPSLVLGRVWDTTFGREAGYLWRHARATLGAALAGFACGVLVGFAVGVTLSQSETTRRLLKPFIDGASAVPPILLVPLITLVFGLGAASKVVTALFIVFFVVFYNTYRGGTSLPPVLRESCRILGASRVQVLWTVVVPSALGWTFAAFPAAVGYALIGVVVAEFFGAPVGLGSIIVTSTNAGGATDLMAAIVLLGLLGAGLVGLAGWSERRFLPWLPAQRTS